MHLHGPCLLDDSLAVVVMAFAVTPLIVPTLCTTIGWGTSKGSLKPVPKRVKEGWTYLWFIAERKEADRTYRTDVTLVRQVKTITVHHGSVSF